MHYCQTRLDMQKLSQISVKKQMLMQAQVNNVELCPKFSKLDRPN